MKKVLNKINEIKDGWFSGSVDLNVDWQKYRYDSCMGCEHNTKNGAIQPMRCKTLSIVVDENFGQCVQCCCPIDKKIVSKTSSCPASKWFQQETVKTGEANITNLMTVKAVSGLSGVSSDKSMFVLHPIEKDGVVILSIEVDKDPTWKTLKLLPGRVCCTSLAQVKKEGRNIIKIKINKEVGDDSDEFFTIQYQKQLLNQSPVIINAYFTIKFKDE